MKIKAWITWPDGSREGWYHCQLLLENGWPIYGHLCSNPGFARSDLWEGRKNRRDDWEKKGLELEIVDEVPYSGLPPEVLENNKKEAYVKFAEQYWPESKSESVEDAKVVVEVSP